MLRTLAISMILVLSVGVMLPFSNSAHGVRQSTQVSMRRHHRYHSRTWWRRYRARLRKKRMAAAALAHRNALLGQPQNIPVSEFNSQPLPALPRAASRISIPTDSSTMALPDQQYSMSVEGAPVPMTLAKKKAAEVTPVAAVPTAKASEARTPVKSASVKLPGQMNISVVALSRPNPVFLTAREESKMLGGTSVSELRRIVIDKMIVSGGWVTNDFVREINGARVFVVTARTPRDRNSAEKAWTFYFTESDGRIYGLTTDATLDSADRMANEAERFINKLHSNSEPNNR